MCEPGDVGKRGECRVTPTSEALVPDAVLSSETGNPQT